VRKLWPGPNPNPSHVYLHLNRQQKQHRFTMSCHFPGIVDRLLSFSGHVQIYACHEYQMPAKKGLIEQLVAGSVAGKKKGRVYRIGKTRRNDTLLKKIACQFPKEPLFKIDTPL